MTNHAITLKVLLFAGLSERIGTHELSIEFDDAPNAAELLKRIADDFPDSADLVRVSRLAVNDSFVSESFVVNTSCRDIAVIPPVSGG